MVITYHRKEVVLLPKPCCKLWSLSPYEIELIALYRGLDDQAQAAVSFVIAAQSVPHRQVIATPVKLHLVENKD